MPALATWLDRLATAQPQSDGRRITHFLDRADELGTVGSELSCKTPLTATGVITVGGADARSFLHGQLTADLRTLGAGQSVLAAWCSPKGRVLFLPRVLVAEEGFHLLLPADQCAPCTKRLRLYALRAKVAIDDTSADRGVLLIRNLPLKDPGGPGGDGVDTAGTDAMYWCVGDLDALARHWQALGGRPRGEDAAALDAIRNGLPSLDASLAETFLPQELDLDRHAGISFEKGCYPGQEIVARVRFRGSVKRRLARMSGELGAPLAAGHRLVAAGTETPVGTVLDSVAWGTGAVEFIAVLDVEAGEVRVHGQPDQPLEWKPLAQTTAL